VRVADRSDPIPDRNQRESREKKQKQRFSEDSRPASILVHRTLSFVVSVIAHSRYYLKRIKSAEVTDASQVIRAERRVADPAVDTQVDVTENAQAEKEQEKKPAHGLPELASAELVHCFSPMASFYQTTD